MWWMGDVLGGVVAWCGGMVWCGVVWCGVGWWVVLWCDGWWCSGVSGSVVWCNVVWCGVLFILSFIYQFFHSSIK